MTTLEAWQNEQLPQLRQVQFRKSKHEDQVTIVIYAFSVRGKEQEIFNGIECSILHTWKILGLMKTSLVVSYEFAQAVEFAQKWDNVTLHIASNLIPNNIDTMSIDCIVNLHTYFSTPYCLIIQNDGFPLSDRLDEFLGKYDYIGAPAVRDSRRWLMRLFGFCAYNGGFSLRSHKICVNASKDWSRFWRFFFSEKGNYFLWEDVFYTMTARLNPVYRFMHKFPSEKEAFRFAYDALCGIIAPPDEKPFGFHGKSTADYYLR